MIEEVELSGSVDEEVALSGSPGDYEEQHLDEEDVASEPDTTLCGESLAWAGVCGGLPSIGEEPSTEWATHVTAEIAEIARKYSSPGSGVDSGAGEPESTGDWEAARSPAKPARGALKASELQEVLGLVTGLVQHIQRLEHDLRAHLETQLANLSFREEVERRELGRVFAEALDMERRLCSQEIAELRAGPAARPSRDAACNTDAGCGKARDGGAGPGAEWLSAVARQEWEALASGAAGLRARALEDISERHAQAALDIAERQLEASRSFDARAAELADLQARACRASAAVAAPEGADGRQALRKKSAGEVDFFHWSSAESLPSTIGNSEAFEPPPGAGAPGRPSLVRRPPVTHRAPFAPVLRPA